MLAQVATTLRERQALRVGFNSEGEVEGGTIVLDENCSVSIYYLIFPRSLLYCRLSYPHIIPAAPVGPRLTTFSNLTGDVTDDDGNQQ